MINILVVICKFVCIAKIPFSVEKGIGRPRMLQEARLARLNIYKTFHKISRTKLLLLYFCNLIQMHQMKLKSFALLLCCLVQVSCQNDNNQLVIDQQIEAQKKDVVFNAINKGWVFTIPPVEPATQARINGWMEWRNFLTEVFQKPKSTLGAFQKKATVLSKKVMDLNNTVPADFGKPQIKSRITALVTKVKSLDLYIHLNQIPDQKVVQHIADINEAIISLQKQMEEVVRRSQIPREAGEPDFIQMKDTTRAIPNTPIQN